LGAKPMKCCVMQLRTVRRPHAVPRSRCWAIPFLWRRAVVCGRSPRRCCYIGLLRCECEYTYDCGDGGRTCCCERALPSCVQRHRGVKKTNEIPPWAATQRGDANSPRVLSGVPTLQELCVVWEWEGGRDTCTRSCMYAASFVFSVRK